METLPQRTRRDGSDMGGPADAGPGPRHLQCARPSRRYCNTGTTEASNPLTGQWEEYLLNVVGNTNGGTWHCVISRLSKKKEATYDLLAFMANKKNAFFNSTNGWTGSSRL
jgi:hypothetical protein